MTQFDFLLIAHTIFAILAYPVMLYCEFNSYAPGHRHVTYGWALALLVLAYIPGVNVIALCVMVYIAYGDTFRAAFSKPMIRETK